MSDNLDKIWRSVLSTVDRLKSPAYQEQANWARGNRPPLKYKPLDVLCSVIINFSVRISNARRLKMTAKKYARTEANN
jgi:hypothetical protein